MKSSLTAIMITLCVVQLAKGDIGMECNENCGEYINLDDGIMKLKMSSIETKLKVVEYPYKVPIKMLRRTRFTELITKVFTTEITREIEKATPPQQKEAEKWIQENACYVGTTCHHSSDCWGRDADYCYEVEMNKKVKTPQHMTISKVPWFKTFYRTCQQDYSCSIENKEGNILLGDDETISVIVDGSKIILPESNNYIFNSLYTLFIEKPQKIRTEILTSQCLEHQEDIFCRISSELLEGYFNFRGEERCKTLYNFLVCRESAVYSNANTQNVKGATVTDLEALNEMVIGVEAKMNYNSMMIERRLWETQKVINKLIKSSLRQNRLLLGDILGVPSNSKIHYNGMIETCPCKRDNEVQCHAEAEVYGLNRKCDSSKNYNITLMSLFGYKELTYNFDKEIDFKGDSVSIMEDLMEDKLKEEHDIGKNKGSGSILNHIGWFSLSSFVDENTLRVIVIVNFAVTLVLFCRARN